jgi:hypothetical protein
MSTVEKVPGEVVSVSEQRRAQRKEKEREKRRSEAAQEASTSQDKAQQGAVVVTLPRAPVLPELEIKEVVQEPHRSVSVAVGPAEEFKSPLSGLYSHRSYGWDRPPFYSTPRWEFSESRGPPVNSWRDWDRPWPMSPFEDWGPPAWQGPEGYPEYEGAEDESESEDSGPEEFGVTPPVLHKQDEVTQEVQDLLESHIDELGEATGPPLGPRMLMLANSYWASGSKKGALTMQKDIYKRYLRPQGLFVQPVACNSDVFSQLPKVVKARELRLRSVQLGIAKAGLPIVQVIDQLTKAPEALDLQALVNQLLDGFKILAGTNGLLNQTRRDMLRTQFTGRTTAVFSDHPPVESEWLLGDDLGDRVKTVSHTSGLKLARRQFGGSSGRGQYGRGRQRGWHPYGSRRGGRGRPYGYGYNQYDSADRKEKKGRKQGRRKQDA